MVALTIELSGDVDKYQVEINGTRYSAPNLKAVASTICNVGQGNCDPTVYKLAHIQNDTYTIAEMDNEDEFLQLYDFLVEYRTNQQRVG